MSQGKCGRLFLLKNDQGDTFAMARVTSVSMNSTLVDATTKSTNSWTEYVPSCGIKSASIALAGLFTNELYEQTLIQDFMSGNIKNYSVVDGYSNTIAGAFAIQDYEMSGSHDGAQEFSATFVSSDEVTYTPSP